MTNPSDLAGDEMRAPTAEEVKFYAWRGPGYWGPRDQVNTDMVMMAREVERLREAAIKAYLPFHPPASREEGLRVKELAWEAEEPNWWVARSIVGGYEVRQTDSGKVRTRRAGEGWEYFDGTTEQAKSAAQEHYTNAILSAIETALIPTKPEAKEEGFPWEISPDAWRQVVERIVKETERVYGPGPVVNAVLAALQSKKPE